MSVISGYKFETPEKPFKRTRYNHPGTAEVEYASSSEHMNSFLQTLRVSVVDKVVEIPHTHEQDITVEVPEYHHHKLIRENAKITRQEVKQHIDVSEITIEEEVVVRADWQREESVKTVEQKTIWEKERVVVNNRSELEESIAEVPVRIPALTVDRVVEKHTVGSIRPVIHYVRDPKVTEEERIEEVTHVINYPELGFVPRPEWRKRTKEVPVPHIERVEKVVTVPREEVREHVKYVDQVDTTQRIKYLPKFEYSGESVSLVTPSRYQGVGVTVELEEAYSRIALLEKEKLDMRTELDQRIKRVNELQASIAKRK